MTAATTASTVAFIFKRMYATGLMDVAFRERPLLSRLRKEGKFGAPSVSDFTYGLKTTNPQGISGDFATAQAAAASSKGEQFRAVPRPKFGVITIAGDILAGAEGDEEAMTDVVTMETDGSMDEFGQRLSHDLYRDGTGNRGRRSSLSTNTVTLTEVTDARNFKRGMTVIASANADGSSPRTGSTTITAINHKEGKITLASAAGITSFSDNDYLFVKGDPDTCMEGLEAHFPLTAPTSGDSFRGVDRSVDVELLAGSRIDDTGTAIDENAGLLAVNISTLGQKADTLVLNPVNFHTVSRTQNAKIEHVGGGTANIGFETFTISTSAGMLRALSDPDCQINRGWVLNEKSIYVRHRKALPHVVDDDGQTARAMANADGIEIRIRGFLNSICDNPAGNGSFSI